MTFYDLLAFAVACDASDLHLRSGQAPWVRVRGKLQRLKDASLVLEQSWLHASLTACMSANDVQRWQHQLALDFACEVPALGRFRAHVFQHSLGCGATFRILRSRLPTLSQLHAPPVLTQWLNHKGLLLVTGATGSGKSTTLAALVQHLNTQEALHIVTLEDPIEFVHISQQSLITQREIGLHSPSFATALRAVLREDPDVILVGEMRDHETIQLALTAAETGHLVLASLHTRSAASSVERIIDVFAGAEKNWIRSQLSEALICIVSQELHPSPNGQARHAVFETLSATHAVRHLIKEGKTSQLQSAMQTGAALGMQTMSQALELAGQHGLIGKNPRMLEKIQASEQTL